MTAQDMTMIYSTFPDMASAEQISRELVAAKYAACANIFQGVRSIYEWEGEMQSDEEVVVLFKTTIDRQQDFMQKLSLLHPYDTPAIIGFHPSTVDAKYLSWLCLQTSSDLT